MHQIWQVLHRCFSLTRSDGGREGFLLRLLLFFLCIWEKICSVLSPENRLQTLCVHTCVGLHTSDTMTTNWKYLMLKLYWSVCKRIQCIMCHLLSYVLHTNTVCPKFISPLTLWANLVKLMCVTWITRRSKKGYVVGGDNVFIYALCVLCVSSGGGEMSRGRKLIER